MYPRNRKADAKKRDKAKLEAFHADRGGGEGVCALLHAREKAEESFGYALLSSACCDWLGCE
jgi:hypothetical protein